MNKIKFEIIYSAFEKFFIEKAAILKDELLFTSPLLLAGLRNAKKKLNNHLKIALDEDGCIDIDTLYEDYKKIFELKPNGLTIWNFKNVSLQDVDMLFEYIIKENELQTKKGKGV